MSHTETPPPWQEAVFQVLKKGGVKQVAYVPDAGHAHAIREATARPRDPATSCSPPRRRASPWSSGAWLGGQRAVLLMQSSGVGNCVNMFSLLTACQFPFLALVTMRGEYAEFNPWQGPMGRGRPGGDGADGHHRAAGRRPEGSRTSSSAALDSAFEAGERVAVLLGQKLIGRKKWERRG